MKKILSILAAAVLACTALCTPVFAAETDAPVYQMGDVNMDGRVDCLDAQLVLMQYTYFLAFNDDILTEQQMALADVMPDDSVDSFDAQGIVEYYAYHTLTHPDVEITIIEYLQAKYPNSSVWASN